MAMLFPGMDPFLEDPQLWPSLHTSMIVYIRDQLQPQLRPRYIATIEERVFVEGPDREVIPDVWIRERLEKSAAVGVAALEADAPEVVTIPSLEVHQRYIAIHYRKSDRPVVTLIELLSPSNKAAGPGRESYLMKQREVLRSPTHLVEVDLLRKGTHTVAVPLGAAKKRGPYQYLACVNRSLGSRAEYEIYRIQRDQRLPRVRIPLADDDPDVVLDLQAAFRHAGEQGEYEIDYSQPCIPPLSPEDQAWADDLIRQSRATPAVPPAPGTAPPPAQSPPPGSPP